MNDRMGRIGTRGKRIGQRAADQRRRVIQQSDHGVFGGVAIIGREIGIQVGARQGAGGFRPLAGRRGAHPMKKLPNDHAAATLLR